MSDYTRIASAIEFIAENATAQPSLDEIAAHVHLSPYHFQRLFSRWAGITPKRFLQVLTLERAKVLLADSQPLLHVADAVGLSSASRLYDHFIHLEAISPGEFKQGGAGLTIEHAVHDSIFGDAFIAVTPRGICRLAFIDTGERDAQLAVLRRQWPQAELREDVERTRPFIDAIFAGGFPADRPLSLLVSGTNFQINVWKALLRIPPGAYASYGQVAAAAGRPGAARAVGMAVGANPIAFVIPCHRVIQQNGALGGYRWGLTRKRAIQAWEAARQP